MAGGVPLLVLWDIDGTLLQRASYEHALAIYAALEQVHGIRRGDVERLRVSAAGRTDGAIARDILLGHGISEARIDDRAADVREKACHHYAQMCPADLSDKVAPGVPETLALLAAEPATYLNSLVTGNLEPIARLKLARAGLGRYFASGQGGFGSDSDSRADLPPLARERAGAAFAADGSPWPRERTVVVGDTPQDIACARADDLRVIGLTTGPFTAEDLSGADAVVSSASELVALLR